MTNFTRAAAIAAALAMGLTALALPSAAVAVAAEEVPGILIDDAAHELPAPSVALASDGSALVVYQGNDPAATTTDSCRATNECVILASVVEADGVTVGEPFVVSGDVVSDDYYSAPEVIWNADLGEWLVLTTSYVTDPDTVSAQRVSADGSLIGSTVVLPVAVTEPGDRATVISETTNDMVLPTASWSPAHQAYLVTWYADGAFGVAGAEGSAMIGYFMTADLASADGVQAGFRLSPPEATALGVQYGSTTHYDPATETWAVRWSTNDRDVWLTGVIFSDEVVTLSLAHQIVDGETVTNMWSQGGMTWVDSQSAWLVSFGGTIETDGVVRYEVQGRYVSGDLFAGPSIGETVVLSAHGDSRFETPIFEGRRHEIAYDAVSDTVYGAGSVRYRDGVDNTAVFGAVMFSFDPTTGTPGEAIELFAPTDAPADGVIEQSSRPRISVTAGGVGATWQNWIGGEYEEPTEIRYALLQAVDGEPGAPAAPAEPELAETGSQSVSALMAFAALLMMAGAVALVVRRRGARATR